MARIVAAGYVVRHPLAGNVWAHLQYILGLARLGHEVWFIEEAGWENSCYDPDVDDMTSDPASGVRVLAGLMEGMGLANRWAFRDWQKRWHGLSGREVRDLLIDADLFLELGGTCDFAEMRHARHRAYVDMDPAFTQFGSFAYGRFNEYDTLFTYGGNIGRATCPVPTLGFDWRPLRPPVVMDLWNPPLAPDLQQGWHNTSTGKSWTTIANWSAYGAREYGGETYGQKDIELLRFIDLPGRTPHRLEVALSRDDAPLALLEKKGWHLVDALAVSRDPWGYREYIWTSRGEFSVAKNAYVKTQCGWFSDRTASYLASGRPAVVQDTGIRQDLPIGCGLLVFGTMSEAVADLDTVETNYEAHCRAARDIAATYFDATRVLSGLLNDCGV